MITLPLLNARLDPLDLLLLGLGYQLSYLSHHQQEDYLALIKNKTKTIQFVSDDGMARYYVFDNGSFRQQMGKADSSDVIIRFSDSMEGAKTLLKGSTALMQAVQEGRLTITGDPKLVLWLGHIIKYATKLPKRYDPYLKDAKSHINKARPTLDKIRQAVKKSYSTLKHK